MQDLNKISGNPDEKGIIIIEIFEIFCMKIKYTSFFVYIEKCKCRKIFIIDIDLLQEATLVYNVNRYVVFGLFSIVF